MADPKEWTLADQHREDEGEYQADLRAEFAPDIARGEAYARMRAALAAGEDELLISADEARALLAEVDRGS